MKQLTDAINISKAKTVTVTINKCGEEFRFKTSAEHLKGLRTYYSAYYMAAPDRREFEKLFGNGADYTVEDIREVTYGRRILYEYEPPVQSESENNISQSKDSPLRSLDMMQRPLMTADELKSLPKGTFIVTKTGFYPIKVKLKLFFEWGIEFEKQPYCVPVRDSNAIKYASRDTLVAAINAKYPHLCHQKTKDEEICRELSTWSR